MTTMSLANIYKSLRPSVVAFVNNFVPIDDEAEEPPTFAPILGTGFVIHEDGLLLTNSHVVNAFGKVPKPDDLPPDVWPVRGILFHSTEAGQIEIPLEIAGVIPVEGIDPGGAYYGPKTGPDLGFVHVKAKGLPTLQLDHTGLIEEGMDIATAGFPMGTDALMGPGWLHQITPTLQRGIISAVLPFPCPAPHAFSIDVMTHGGASGSPVVSCETGHVLGVLYAGLTDVGMTLKHNDLFRVPTSISYVVPSHYIAHLLPKIINEGIIPPVADALSIEEMLKQSTLTNVLESDRDWTIWGNARTEDAAGSKGEGRSDSSTRDRASESG